MFIRRRFATTPGATWCGRMNIDDRLTKASGTFFFSGLSMLVRLPMEQARRDRTAGLRTGTLVSGYPGSPLGGYDGQLAKASATFDELDLVHLPAGNEEQAVTALMGTQMLDDHPHSRNVGVTGFWYGKGPGLDRSGDALKHANFAGTSRAGAVVVLSGEDHEAKSSTMPFQQDFGFVAAGMPILYPSSVAEFRSLGLHAVAMSRYSGCWVALKLTASLCDGGETVTVGEDDVRTLTPQPGPEDGQFQKRTDFSFYPGKNIDHERHLYRDKHRAALAYARANRLNRVESRTPQDRIGIISAGKSAADVRQALTDLGLAPDALASGGIALLTLGMIYPLDERLIRDFCAGLDEVIVVEEKRAFLESAVRAALQSTNTETTVVGKADESGADLFPIEGAMDPDVIAALLSQRIAKILPAEGLARLAALGAVRDRDYQAFQPRTPNFCSGCPHSTSTVLGPGQVAFGAPGCSCFNEVIDQPERHIDTMTHYGGEGSAWVGLAPFTDRPHLVQHVGDGSIYHSSYLNVRWAVATNTRMTFKLLWNGVVANTGAQLAPGERGLAALTRGLESEGVARIVICTKDPRQYRRQRLGKGVQVRPSDDLVAVSQELEQVDGVTVLIYDEFCANERRRRIKRGTIEPPIEYTVINERACENCGDCGRKSNCMSLQKVETEFGQKTQIHASSCNNDNACMQGDCPSFATVTVRKGTAHSVRNPPPIQSDDLREPDLHPDAGRPFHVYIPGVGGTGVLTLNAVLAFAASMDGYRVMSFDQTGAAQKWGPVLSSLTLLHGAETWPPLGTGSDGQAGSVSPAVHANQVGVARASLYLALDEVAAVSPSNLDRCDPTATAAVINTDLFPTGEMIRDSRRTPSTDEMEAAIRRFTRPDRTSAVPARLLAERLFGDYMMTNVVALGVAYQAGFLPLAASSIEKAIHLNGVSVARNILAFRYGRLWVTDQDRVTALVSPPMRSAEAERGHWQRRLSKRQRSHYLELTSSARSHHLSDDFCRLLNIRIGELILYQSHRLAGRYLTTVIGVAEEVRVRAPKATSLAPAVAANLFKLMAYKDEYEVARLYLDPEWRAQVEATFQAPVKVSYNLHPPAARLAGRSRKLRLGPWFTLVFRGLYAMRGLRGTTFDPFGRQQSRREERALIEWYLALIERALEQLRPATADVVQRIAELPDQIRGYERVKSESAARTRDRANE